MHRFVWWLVAGLAFGCSSEPPVRPSGVVRCPDGGCPPSPAFPGGGVVGGGGTPLGDAGSTFDASLDASVSTPASGSLRLVQTLPPSSVWISSTIPARWTISALDNPMLATAVDSTGAWTLLGVPTRRPSGSLAPLVALLATPPVNDLGAVQLLRAGESSSTLYAMGIAELLSVVSPAGIVPDLGASHVVLFCVDAGPTATPQNGVTLAVGSLSVPVLYDDERGLMAQTFAGTGRAGVALALNIPPVGASRDPRDVVLSINRGGRTLSLSVPVVPQAITWVGVNAP